MTQLNSITWSIIIKIAMICSQIHPRWMVLNNYIQIIMIKRRQFCGSKRTKAAKIYLDLSLQKKSWFLMITINCNVEFNITWTPAYKCSQRKRFIFSCWYFFSDFRSFTFRINYLLSLFLNFSKSHFTIVVLPGKQNRFYLITLNRFPNDLFVLYLTRCSPKNTTWCQLLTKPLTLY